MTEYKEPAFPGQFVHDAGQIESWIGISMRDYFAAKAMHASILELSDNEIISCEMVATWAYKMADAMIEARK